MTHDNAPANPRFDSAVRDSFARQGLMTLFGAMLAEVSPGRVVIEVPFADRLSQQQGLFHGAVVGAIGDSASGYASLTLMPPQSEVVSVEYKINFLRPAAGDLLRAVGEVVRAGRSVTVARTEVLCRDGQALRPCATLLATMMRVEPGQR